MRLDLQYVQLVFLVAHQASQVAGFAPPGLIGFHQATPNTITNNEQQQHQKQQQQPRCGSTQLSAKKKGKKKGGKSKNNKKSGFEWAASFTLKPFEATAVRELASTACASFEGRTGQPLCDELQSAADVPKALWNAPVACVVVDMYAPQSAAENDEEAAAVAAAAAEKDDGEEQDDEQEPPATGQFVVKYANVAALETFGIKPDQFDQLIAMPDKEGALQIPTSKVAAAISLPAEMKGDKKYESGYKKKLLRASDLDADDDSTKDISITDGDRWSIEKSNFVDGKFITQTIGVAYAWKSWVEGETTVCRPGGVREFNVSAEGIEAQIAAKAAEIRELKEVQGFGNKDPEVMDAVDELLELKEMLAEVKE